MVAHDGVTMYGVCIDMRKSILSVKGIAVFLPGLVYARNNLDFLSNPIFLITSRALLIIIDE